MKLDFSKNTRRNVIAAAINRLMGALFPFLNRTLFLWVLGPAYLGLNGLFGSILGVLMLADLGFGTAVVCSMYKPVADDNKDLLCAYLRFYRTVYRWVGFVIFAGGMCLLPFLRRLVHGSVPPDIDLHVLYVLVVFHFFHSFTGNIVHFCIDRQCRLFYSLLLQRVNNCHFSYSICAKCPAGSLAQLNT